MNDVSLWVFRSGMPLLASHISTNFSREVATIPRPGMGQRDKAFSDSCRAVLIPLIATTLEDAGGEDDDGRDSRGSTDVARSSVAYSGGEVGRDVFVKCVMDSFVDIPDLDGGGGSRRRALVLDGSSCSPESEVTEEM